MMMIMEKDGKSEIQADAHVVVAVHDDDHDDDDGYADAEPCRNLRGEFDPESQSEGCVQRDLCE